MATTNNERTHTISSYDGGVQRRSTRFLTRQNELRMSINSDLQRVLGGISKSLGYEQLGNAIASGATILGCGSLTTDTGTRKLIAFADSGSNGDAFIYNAGTGNWDAQSLSLDTEQSYETANFLNRMYRASGAVNRLAYYSGSGWTTPWGFSDAPLGFYIIEFNSRLYLFKIHLWGTDSFYSRCWYSDLPTNSGGTENVTWGLELGSDLVTTASSAVVTSAGATFITNNIKVGDPFFIYDGTDVGEYEVKTIDSNTQITLTKTLTTSDTAIQYWVGGNWFDVATNNSDIGMGLGKNSDRLLLFKRFSLWKFNKGVTSESDTLIQVKGVPGTTSSRSIVNMYGWTFYWADSGLWRYDGNTSELISGTIQDVVDGISSSSLFDVVGWQEGDRVLKMYVGDISNTVTNLSVSKCVVCFDVLAENFWFESFADAVTCATSWTESSTAKVQNILFSSQGEALETETGNSHDNTAISMEVETPFYFPISPEVENGFTRFRIYTQNGQGITAQYKLAYADGRVDTDWHELDVIYKNQDEQLLRVKETERRASGYALKFRESSSTNARPVIERHVAYYIPGGLR